jgi:hypothetical protein
MTLDAWSDARLITEHRASHQEIGDLLVIAETDLRDAAIAELSPERKLACGYGAILAAARSALQATGYRIPKSNRNHHHYAIRSLRYTILLESELLLRIEACRRNGTTQTMYASARCPRRWSPETRQLAEQILHRVRHWLEENYRNLWSE